MGWLDIELQIKDFTRQTNVADMDIVIHCIRHRQDSVFYV